MAVRLPDALYRLVKRESVESGDSMNAVVVRRLVRSYERSSRRRKRIGDALLRLGVAGAVGLVVRAFTKRRR